MIYYYLVEGQFLYVPTLAKSNQIIEPRYTTTY
jgi:hypothetical protein